MRTGNSSDFGGCDGLGNILQSLIFCVCLGHNSSYVKSTASFLELSSTKLSFHALLHSPFLSLHLRRALPCIWLDTRAIAGPAFEKNMQGTSSPICAGAGRTVPPTVFVGNPPTSIHPPGPPPVHCMLCAMTLLWKYAPHAVPWGHPQL
jgi:hypothetical protein